MKSVRKIIAIIMIFAISISSYHIITVFDSHRKSSDFYNGLQPTVNTTESIADTTKGDIDAEESIKNIYYPVIDFDKLRRINSDVIGWIYIDGTSINYPVVQGQDNHYYLKHLFNKDSGVAGCIFLDSENSCDLTDDNNVFYGHHMRDQSMFSSLTNYKEQAYYNQHPTAIYITPNTVYEIVFFSGYVAHTYDDAWNLDFNSKDEKITWLRATKSNSTFESDIEPFWDDKIVTLSTCSYEFKNARYVLVGILRKLHY